MNRQARYGLALSLCLLLAFAVRLYRLDGQSLWYDEGVTAELAQRSLGALTEWTAGDIQPPLYYYAAALWGRVAGWSEWSLRWPSAAFGVLGAALCAAVALELTQRRMAALLAAWLAALHPLLLYYGQEARMYSMLTALGLAAALLLLRSLRPTATWRTWALFALAGAAAAYTHYFAFFLLAGLAAAALWDVQRSAAALRRRQARSLLAAYAAIVLLYLPWLAILFSQLAFDSSYWQGRLKLGEALRSVLVSFTSGETVREPLAFWLLIPYALLTLPPAWAAARRPFARRALVYSLCWLVAPVAAVLLLASFAPKFSPRYTMIALPGLLLLWSTGAAALLEPAGPRPRFSRAAAGLLVAALTVGFVYAGLSWFTDPAFTKDQWRELARDLRGRLAPEEKVVLVSGHAWPVWHYYAPDIDALRLPNIDVLDVNAVLDFGDTAAPLRAALDPLSERPGVWLVLWQDEVVDPTGVVPVQLVIGGREKGMDTRLWGIGLRRFSGLKTNWFADEPPITLPLDIAYSDGALILRGATTIDNGDLLLFWERRDGDRALPDYELSGESFADGAPLLPLEARRLAGYDYPSFRWPAGKVVMGRIPAAEWLGASPQSGSYSVRLAVHDAAAGGSPVPTEDGQDAVMVGPLEVAIE